MHCFYSEVQYMSTWVLVALVGIGVSLKILLLTCRVASSVVLFIVVSYTTNYLFTNVLNNISSVVYLNIGLGKYGTKK